MKASERIMILRAPIVGLLGLGIFILVIAFAYRELIGKYGREYAGMTEAQVVSALGKPDVDDRRIPGYEAKRGYILGWYLFDGRQLALEFHDGSVIRQWYGSK